MGGSFREGPLVLPDRPDGGGAEPPPAQETLQLTRNRKKSSIKKPLLKTETINNKVVTTVTIEENTNDIKSNVKTPAAVNAVEKWVDENNIVENKIEEEVEIGVKVKKMQIEADVHIGDEDTPALPSPIPPVTTNGINLNFDVGESDDWGVTTQL